MIMPCKNQTWIPSHSTGAGVSDVTVCLPRKKDDAVGGQFV